MTQKPKDLTLEELELALAFLSQNPSLTRPIPHPLKQMNELQWVTVQEILEELVMEQANSTIH